MLTRADVSAGPPADFPATSPAWTYNFWEVCNGAGSCVNPGFGQAFRCDCAENCDNTYQPGFPIPIPTGFNVGNDLRKCMYCGPPVPQCKRLNNCSYFSSTYVGVEDRIELWNGVLQDGSDVFHPDRKVSMGSRERGEGGQRARSPRACVRCAEGR